MTTDELRDSILTYLDAEIACEPLKGEDRRIGCLTPLEYPSGDGVTVWVDPREGDRVDVSDHGEAYVTLLERPPQDYKALHDMAVQFAAESGLRYDRGQFSVRTERGETADAVWRVATASVRLAEAAFLYRPRRRRSKENEFVRTVESEFLLRRVPVRREEKLVGSSGHTHRATFVLPRQETVMEPIGAEGHWSQVASVYARLGDLSNANGYRMYSLLDDRTGQVDEEITKLLLQVSRVVEWSHREEWLGSL
jgi:hypothetical protein